jgi:cell division transport system permease protein
MQMTDKSIPAKPAEATMANQGRKNSASVRLKHYFTEHQQTASASLGQLWLKPLSSLMTIMVIGLSLALPLCLSVLLENGQQLIGSWQGQSQMSLFLRMETSEDDAKQLMQTLAAHSDVKNVRYLSKEQSLKDYEDLTGTRVAIDLLEGNPLPAVIVLEPKSSDAAILKKMKDELLKLAPVEFAQMDLQWVERLQAILQLGTYLVQALALMLALVLLFVVMNTLKLLIENRRNEIDITLLVGGSHTYIRRPFLYLGFWYGLLGALLAVSAVEMLLGWIEEPVTMLSNLYQSQFTLHSMSLDLFFQVLGFSSLLGVIGAWIEVSLHLYRARPK